MIASNFWVRNGAVSSPHSTDHFRFPEKEATFPHLVDKPNMTKSKTMKAVNEAEFHLINRATERICSQLESGSGD